MDEWYPVDEYDPGDKYPLHLQKPINVNNLYNFIYGCLHSLFSDQITAINKQIERILVPPQDEIGLYDTLFNIHN